MGGGGLGCLGKEGRFFFVGVGVLFVSWFFELLFLFDGTGVASVLGVVGVIFLWA